MFSIPSLLTSTHFLVILMLVLPGTYVFVIVVNPVFSFNEYPVCVYPSGRESVSSVHLYSISSPPEYFGKFSIVAVQLLPLFKVTSSPLLSLTFKDVGRFPSSFSPSFHTFLTDTAVVSGV